MPQLITDDTSLLNAENVLRWVPNDRIYFDDNENKLKAYDRDDSLWGFFFEEEVNKGLSVDHRERILADRPEAASFRDALQDYVTIAMSLPYFEKRSWLRLNIGVLRDLGLPITCTPYDNGRRPHHCDVWPTDPHNNYTGDQYHVISESYEVEVNNRDIP